MSEHAQSLDHRRIRMSGRDSAERGRSATTLELLFDLTFVVAFGVAADQLAHFLAEDHLKTGVLGFAFTTFAITWAWINFSWFASAYDTDDWLFRVTTLVQMVGVLVLALGIPPLFESIDKGAVLDNRVMVAGYVVMRVAMVGHWLRAWAGDPSRRSACRTYIATILIAQVGWVALLVAETKLGVTLAWALVLMLVELVGPLLAETRKGGTPWHAHHLAERYGLLVIIALGEGMIGTMATLAAIVGGTGWSLDVAVVGFAGTALTFGLWWNYFVIPHGPILHARRSRLFAWGYGHIPLFGAVVAVGAGLHVAAYFIEHHTELGAFATLMTVAVPLAVFATLLYVGYAVFTRTVDPFHFLLVGLTAACLALPLWMSSLGVTLPWCLLLLAATPWVTVIGYELRGHRHNEELLRSL